jgi:hypothetical protein
VLGKRQALQLEQSATKLDSFNLLIFDAYSYVACDQTETSVLLEPIVAGYGAPISAGHCQPACGEQSRPFRIPEMTVSAIDRLVHHATIVHMNSESYRRRSAVSARPANSTVPCHANAFASSDHNQPLSHRRAANASSLLRCQSIQIFALQPLRLTAGSADVADAR